MELYNNQNKKKSQVCLLQTWDCWSQFNEGFTNFKIVDFTFNYLKQAPGNSQSGHYDRNHAHQFDKDIQ